jgi:hypothetical protein
MRQETKVRSKERKPLDVLSVHDSQYGYLKMLVNPILFLLLLTLASIHSTSPKSVLWFFLNKRVRYAIESATARYPMIVIKLAMVEATKGE